MSEGLKKLKVTQSSSLALKDDGQIIRGWSKCNKDSCTLILSFLVFNSNYPTICKQWKEILYTKVSKYFPCSTYVNTHF
jgi:hypothetical protein